MAGALRAAADSLRANSETARLDAELLLAFVLGVDRARLVMIAGDAPAPADMARFESLVARRRAGEPVAYLIGMRAFRRLELTVDPRVLIPRPETELLVEVGLALPFGATVLDVGSGSGAIALALKDERPDLRVSGVDASAGAVELARSNAARLGLEVEFAVGDLLDGVTEPPDAVLANLPYVAEADVLPVDVAGYEPHGALYAGPDGLELIRRLIGQLDRVPVAALEVGEGQAAAVARLLAGAGFGAVERRRDLAGIDRVVVGRR